MSFDLKEYFQQKRSLIDTVMKERWVPATQTDPALLHESIHYSLFAPGKRIRPILVLAAGEALGLNEQDVLPIACGLEMVHVFSLVHDDLPAMDDDDLRRGQPTNHKKFGEATAILAGDALLAQAFVPLSDLDQNKFNPAAVIKVIRELALATGLQGMIVGQMIDLESEGKDISLERLKKLHAHKTGALLRYAVQAPGLLSEQNNEVMQNLTTYGEAVGLAFQIADDILDIEGGAELGKDIGSDIENGKATYPALMGLNEAKAEAKRVLNQALEAADFFGDKGQVLKAIARFVVERTW